MLTASAVKKYVFYFVHIFLIVFITAIYFISRSPVSQRNDPQILGVETNRVVESDFTDNDSSYQVTSDISSFSSMQESFYAPIGSAIDTSLSNAVNFSSLPNTAASYKFTSSLIGLSVVLIIDSILILRAKTRIKIKLKKPNIQTYLFNPTTTTSCQTF